MSKHKQTYKSDSPEEEQLWEYLSGDLAQEQQYEAELAHVDDPFWADATEGLSNVEDKDALKRLHFQLQQQIRTQTSKRKNKRKRNFVQSAVIAIFVILIIVVVTYLVTHFSIKK